MGRQIWVDYPARPETLLPGHVTGPIRVLSFKQFLPAAPPVRTKHLVQLWTDPGGMRTLSVGSIRLKDPGKVAAGKAAAETRRQQQEEDDD